MGKIPTQVSESVRRRNPHLYGGDYLSDTYTKKSIKGHFESLDEHLRGNNVPPVPLKRRIRIRIRQSSKPKMNKLETEWFNLISGTYNLCHIQCQSIKLELANGLWYVPDFFVAGNSMYPARSIAWEVKGPHAFGGALEKLKMAARAHPWCKFYLVWKLDGKWQEQEVLP